jgi:hypothetical protein
VAGEALLSVDRAATRGWLDCLGYGDMRLSFEAVVP